MKIFSDKYSKAEVHFNRKGHKIADMSMTILEKVHSQDAMVLSIREEHWIRQGNTKYRGINRNRSWQLTKSCYLQFFLKNSFELYFQEDQPGYSWIFVIVYMYLTLIWVLQIPTSMCLDIEGLGSLSDDEISLNISKYTYYKAELKIKVFSGRLRRQ